MYTNLIDAGELAESMASQSIAIFDCRHDLMKPQWGRQAYLQAHVPGAMYVALDADLSGPPLTDHGRHPLLSESAMRELFSRLGIAPDCQVVVYDQRDGSIAARMWWMLRYMGHESVAVLNGGFPAWQRAQQPICDGDETRQPCEFVGSARAQCLAVLSDLPAARRIVDARLAARYRGELEPLDRIPGHIPGARNLPFMDNVDEDGLFRAAQAVRMNFESALDGASAGDVVYACGSGVTACHLALAAHWLDLDEGRIYVGSYSEWSRDPQRQVAIGDKPGEMPDTLVDANSPRQ